MRGEQSRLLAFTAFLCCRIRSKLYFESLRARVLFVEFKNKEKAFKNGFVAAYKNYLERHLDIDWDSEGIDFSLIEQVVLARNRSNHPDWLQDVQPDHDLRTLRKYPQPFFATKDEIEVFDQTSDSGRFAMLPSVHVSKEKLVLSIREIEKMANLIDRKLYGGGRSDQGN